MKIIIMSDDGLKIQYHQGIIKELHGLFLHIIFSTGLVTPHATGASAGRILPSLS